MADAVVPPEFCRAINGPCSSPELCKATGCIGEKMRERQNQPNTFDPPQPPIDKVERLRKHLAEEQAVPPLHKRISFDVPTVISQEMGVVFVVEHLLNQLGGPSSQRRVLNYLKDKFNV